MLLLPPLIERQPAPRSAQESLQPLRLYGSVVGVTQAYSDGSTGVLGLGEGTVLSCAGAVLLLLVSEGGGAAAAALGAAGEGLARAPVSWSASSPKALTAADSWSRLCFRAAVSAAAWSGEGSCSRRREVPVAVDSCSVRDTVGHG
jgi:hypothetical protein